MGDFNRMLAQIEKKMEAGFRCIKLKIGAINFEEELRFTPTYPLSLFF